MPPLSLSFVDLTSLYCKLFLSPSPSLDRALLSKIIHTLIVQWQCQADLPIPALYSFFTKAFYAICNKLSTMLHIASIVYYRYDTKPSLSVPLRLLY